MRSDQKAVFAFMLGALCASPAVMNSRLIAQETSRESATTAPTASSSAGPTAAPNAAFAPAARTASVDHVPRLPKPAFTQPSQSANANSERYVDTRDAVVLSSRSFEIPFNVDRNEALPAEVHLLVSRGADSAWRLLDRQPPTVRGFQYKGTADGLFWFTTRTVDAAGNQSPADPLQPQLKVYIDTAKPEINLNAESDPAGRVQASIRYEDATAVKSTQLHYATDVLRQWTVLDTTQIGSSGKFAFTPQEDWQQLSLQVIVVDSAGNQTIESKLLQRPRIAVGPKPKLAAAFPPTQTADDVHKNLHSDVHNADYLPSDEDPANSIQLTAGVSTNKFIVQRESKDSEASAKIAQRPLMPATAPYVSTPSAATQGASPQYDPRHFDPRQLDPRQMDPRALQQAPVGRVRMMPDAATFGPPSVVPQQMQTNAAQRPTLPALPGAPAVAADRRLTLQSQPSNMVPPVNREPLTGSRRMIAPNTVRSPLPSNFTPSNFTPPSHVDQPSGFGSGDTLGTSRSYAPPGMSRPYPSTAAATPNPRTPLPYAAQAPAPQYPPQAAPSRYPAQASPQATTDGPTLAAPYAPPPAATADQISKYGAQQPTGLTMPSRETLTQQRTPPRTAAEAMRPIDKTANDKTTAMTLLPIQQQTLSPFLLRAESLTPTHPSIVRCVVHNKTSTAQC